MTLTASTLRQNIYKFLDEVVEKGKTLEIVRKGKIIKIIPPPCTNRLDRLKKRKGVFNCDPEEFVHMDWSHEWKP